MKQLPTITELLAERDRLRARIKEIARILKSLRMQESRKTVADKSTESEPKITQTITSLDDLTPASFERLMKQIRGQ